MLRVAENTTRENERYTEWLVTDQRGAFAMGTSEGVRTRKYHGFYLGIPGRAETAFLADFELQLNGLRIWPHRYGATQSVEGGGEVASVIDPTILPGFSYELTARGPRWKFPVGSGALFFEVRRGRCAGIELAWTWSGTQKANFQLRPFFAMRPLHGNGGQAWTIRRTGDLFHIQADAHQVLSRWSTRAQWKDSPLWYQNFFYVEELARGYTAAENLFSAGVFEMDLEPSQEAVWSVAERAQDLTASQKSQELTGTKTGAFPALDFVLTEPAGIVAGYPWFGEWGRDTFVSLPGIVAARLEAGEPRERIREWAYDVLSRWGDWIQRVGMIPNVIEQDGSHQWESADGALWWCHALASLWVLGLDDAELFPDIEERYAVALDAAVLAIRDGRHLFLKRDDRDLLEVTEAHTTWMDARIDGAPVTPRTGILPEINALWFQARLLRYLWTGEDDYVSLERLAHAVLAVAREPERPNEVFFHSLPLAPSFVLKDWEALRADLRSLRQRFLTPVGLRTLFPKHPQYHGRCVGHQRDRDQAYHQGSVWGWLAGHYEMAENRSPSEMTAGNSAIETSRFETSFRSAWEKKEFPIEGHIPEIFDGDSPHVARGAPAQAWSLACSVESKTRKSRDLDRKLTRVLSKRWTGRKRNSKTRSPGEPVI
jgi:glycogen debranching enzyme